MILSFKCEQTKKVFYGEKSKKFATIAKVAKRKLDMLHYAVKVQDLNVPPNNRFEHLKGDLIGYCSIRINDQFRIVFKFENGFAYDVYITDYHD